jgi:hypothetical protein
MQSYTTFKITKHGISIMDESPLTLFFSLPAWIVPSLFPIALAIYFQMRSGSSYSLVNRLYALLIGGSEFSDAKLKKFWEERTDVERFNALFHMQAKTIKEIHWFQKRVQKNELNIQFFSKMRGGFNSQLRKIKKLSPKLYYSSISALGLILIIVVLAIQPLLFIASSDGAILKLKDEDQWMSINRNGFSSVSWFPLAEIGKEWAFDKAACTSLETNLLVEKTKLLKPSVEIICNSFDDSGSLIYFEKTIKDQKNFWYIGALYFVVAVFLGRLIISTIHTYRGRKALLEAYLQARRNRILRSGNNKRSTTANSKAPEDRKQREELTS